VPWMVVVACRFELVLVDSSAAMAASDPAALLFGAVSGGEIRPERKFGPALRLRRRKRK